MGKITEICSFLRSNWYKIYCLNLLMLAYLINQWNTFSLIATNLSMAQDIGYGERVCDFKDENRTALPETMIQNTSSLTTQGLQIISTSDDYCNSHQYLCDNSDDTRCSWRYLGRGLEYQLLAGPLYIVLFSISGIPMGLVSELNNINRKICLSLCIILWSLMTVLSGFATEYWHLAVTRLLLGIFSAGAVPFSASMIADLFKPKYHGSALGYFNWGVYIGFSLTFILLIVEKQLGWQAVYFVSGVPGIAIGLLILFSVKDPERSETARSKLALNKMSSMWSNLKRAFTYFVDPTLLLHCLGGAFRNGGGIVWAYNNVIFFDKYWPGVNIEVYMSWIPLVFGSIGAFGGGYLSDKLSKKKHMGYGGRMAVLIGCLLLSAPFQAMVLYLPPPWCFVTHMVGLLIGEMWIGVCIAVVLEIVPSDLKTSSIAVYFFIIQIIGGNMNLFVTPITNNLDMQTALLICFPGLYVVGAMFFIITWLVLRRKRRLINKDEHKDISDDDNSDTELSAPVICETDKH